MDVNDLRSLVTLLSFAAFVAVVVSVYRRSRRASYDAAAQLPFQDEGRDAKESNGANP